MSRRTHWGILVPCGTRHNPPGEHHNKNRAGRHRLRSCCAAGLLLLLAGSSLTLAYCDADSIILW